MDKLSFRTLILDVDGVILDSNFLKEENIFKAASDYVNSETAENFASYFTSLNGVPREKKIFSFFKDEILAQNILNKYNSLNVNTLQNVELTSGVIDFFEKVKGKLRIIALSGGDEKEVKYILNHKKILSNFDLVLGGPLTKEENLDNYPVDKPALYIGDSKVDYEVATSIDATFIFMYGYTQFSDWKHFFENKDDVRSIKDFNEISNANIL
jgi:phosphoglycolate phosphatase-like HAD superfamily hydrolase